MEYRQVNYPPFYIGLWIIFFPEADFEKGTIFAWGKKIYAKQPLTIPLTAHEAVHIEQQKNSYLWGMVWLIRYALSKTFRLAQEIPAHQAEFRCVRQMLKDTKRKAIYLDLAAERLSSPLYGSLISRERARTLIRNR